MHHRAAVVAGLTLCLGLGALGCSAADTNSSTSSSQPAQDTSAHSYDNDHFGVSIVPPDGYVDVTLTVQEPEVFLFGSMSDVGNTICVTRYELWEKSKAANLHEYAEELAAQAKETAQSVNHSETDFGNTHTQVIRTMSIVDSEPQYRDVFLFIDIDNTVLQITLDASSEEDLYELDGALRPLS